MCFSVDIYLCVCLLSHSYVHCTTECTLSRKSHDGKSLFKRLICLWTWDWWLGEGSTGEPNKTWPGLGGSFHRIKSIEMDINWFSYLSANEPFHGDEKCLIKYIRKKNVCEQMHKRHANMSMWHTDTLSVSANMFTVSLDHRTLTKQFAQQSSTFICQKTSVQVSLRLSVRHLMWLTSLSE